MKKQTILVVGIMFLSGLLAACSWSPEVTAVPITAPWNAMNLPVGQDAVVWGSSDKEFKAVHKDDKKTVTKSYTEALKTQGWTLGEFNTEPSGAFSAEMAKGGERISLRFYDFDNTGVIIAKK